MLFTDLFCPWLNPLQGKTLETRVLHGRSPGVSLQLELGADGIIKTAAAGPGSEEEQNLTFRWV